MATHVLPHDPPAPLLITVPFLGPFYQIWWRPQRYWAPRWVIQDVVEEKNPPWSLPWGQAPLRNQTDARFWDRTHWSWNSPFPGLKAWFDWLGSLQGAGRISESTPLCSRHHLCAGCRAPSMMGSSYSFLVLWQITVMELSWSLTTFHCVVLHGGKPSSVTVNFSLI